MKEDKLNFTIALHPIWLELTWVVFQGRMEKVSLYTWAKQVETYLKIAVNGKQRM